MLVTIATSFDLADRRYIAGQDVDVDRTVALRWIADGKATTDANNAQNPVPDAIQALVSGDVISGAWRNLPASGVIMRARMTGTGTLTMDSATGDLGAGTVTTAAYAATVVGTQIDDYAYPGDAARSIRFTLTGTAAVEVY